MDLEWLTKTVDTSKRPCPLIRKKCPGTRSGCAFWLEFSVQNATGSSVIRSGCLFAWQYVMANENVVETVRTQATFDKTATELRGVTVAARGAFEAALVRSRALPA